MRKRILILVFISFIINSVNAQINISVDNSCINKNSKLIAQELIEIFGKDYVSELLDNNIRLLLFFKFDSLGNTTLEKSIIRNNSSIESQNSSISKIEKLKSDLNLNLKIKKGYFSICYERIPGWSDSASIKLISRDLYKDKEKILINVAFPGELLIYYELDNEKAKKEGKYMTKYEYLENKINNSH